MMEKVLFVEKELAKLKNERGMIIAREKQREEDEFMDDIIDEIHLKWVHRIETELDISVSGWLILMRQFFGISKSYVPGFHWNMLYTPKV